MPSANEFLLTQIRTRLRQAREARGWSQKQLAQALGVEEATVANWEKGRSRIALDKLYLVANVLDFPLTYFLPNLGETPEDAFGELLARPLREILEVSRAAFDSAKSITSEEVNPWAGVMEEAARSGLSPEAVRMMLQALMKAKEGSAK